MDLLADNDAIVKLGQCRLLREFLMCFEVGSRYFVTETFQPWLRGRIKNGRVPEYVGLEVLAIAPLAVQIPQQNELLLNEIPTNEIDAGESVLIAAAYGSASKILFTGDKRAIKALANHPSIEKLRSGLVGKLICVEQAVLMLIDRHGFEPVRSNIVATLQVNSDLDTALRACFGSGMLATEENVISALESYVTELREIADCLLFIP